MFLLLLCVLHTLSNILLDLVQMNPHAPPGDTTGHLIVSKTGMIIGNEHLTSWLQTLLKPNDGRPACDFLHTHIINHTTTQLFVFWLSFIISYHGHHIPPYQLDI